MAMDFFTTPICGTSAYSRGRMRRTFISVATGLVAWPVIALAQAATAGRGPSLESPGEIAVWSTVITQKQEYCRRQAQARKLHFFKRRRFIRDCMNK